MLIKFSSPSYSDITMFDDVAITLLKMMGHSGTVPGAILAKDIPNALQKLEQGLNQVSALPNDKHTSKKNQEPDEREEPVSLAHRAFPLVEMLKSAVEQNCNVMWNK